MDSVAVNAIMRGSGLRWWSSVSSTVETDRIEPRGTRRSAEEERSSAAPLGGDAARTEPKPGARVGSCEQKKRRQRRKTNEGPFDRMIRGDGMHHRILPSLFFLMSSLFVRRPEWDYRLSGWQFGQMNVLRPAAVRCSIGVRHLRQGLPARWYTRWRTWNRPRSLSAVR